MLRLPAMTQPMPPLNIPRIVPPQGERLPLHGGPVTPLELVPSVVPNPPIQPSDIPRTQRMMPKPASAIAAAEANKPPQAPWYVLECDFPQHATPHPDQLLWLFARFDLEEVQRDWAASFDSAVWSAAHLQFKTETGQYAIALQAFEAKKLEAEEAAHRAAEQAAAQTAPAPAPASPASVAAPAGSMPITMPIVLALQQAGALGLGARWELHGSRCVIIGYGPQTHNPLEQQIMLRADSGNGHTTQLKFMTTTEAGWKYIGPAETSVSASAPASTPSPSSSPEPAELSSADLAAIHHDAPANPQPANPPQTDGNGEVKRRLTSNGKARCIELAGQGKTKTEIAQATGLPMELVERALAGVVLSQPARTWSDQPAPVSVQDQSAAAEKAYQKTLENGGTETEAREASTEAIEKSVGLPSAFRLVGATMRLAQGIDAYPGNGLIEQLREMREDIDLVLAAIEEGD